MKAHLVPSIAAAILLLSTSYAVPPNTGNASKTVAMEFNARTGEWKSAGPKPAVANFPLTPVQRKAQRIPWTWRRVAMQPLRFIVMAAKIPLIPAGFMAAAVIVGNANAHGYPMEFPDFGQAFESFDPGPAIDADLERMHPRTIPKDERAPSPLNSELRVTHAMTSTSGRPTTSIDIAYNRQSKASSTPVATAAARSPAVVRHPDLTDLDLLLMVSAPGPAISTDLRLTGPLLALKDEYAPSQFGSDLRLFGETPASIMRPSASMDVAVNR